MTRQPARWPNEDYAALEAALRSRAGLVFQPMRRSAVESAAARVMASVGIASPEAFVPLVRQNGAVFDDLMAEVTIGETYFFRELGHFTHLRNTIIPEFRRRVTGNQKFRAWSAACSTGEEAYSIALTLREEGLAAGVVGTDVSRARLAAARRGEYRAWSFRGVPDATVQRYFARDDDRFTLAPDVRRDVEFRYLNLASDCYPELSSGVWGMDLIFCRNVLIYFDRDTIAHVAKSLLASLGDDGWLLLGAGLAYRHFRGTRYRTIDPEVRVVARVAPPVAQPQPTVALPASPAPARESELASSGITSALSAVGGPPAITAESATAGAVAAYARRDYDGVVALLEPRIGVLLASSQEFVLYVRALANMGRLGDAGRACVAGLERYRDSPELHYLHAVLVAQGGQFAESARAAKRAIYLDRGMIVAHLALGSALARSGDAVGAARAFAASERLLSTLDGASPVPGTDGEPAGRLLEMTRLQAALVRQGVAA